MATTLALGLGVAYTLTVGVAQGPSASSPESFAASTEKIDCILGEIIPTPVVECGQTVRVKKPILVAAQNGGAPCPDEYVDFQGEECKCPDGLPINPNRNDCIGPAKRLVNGCCEDGLCPDGSIRIPGGIGCKAEDGFKELDGCCICPCCDTDDPCCGSTDECCGSLDLCCGKVCDDQDICTTDSCSDGTCYHDSLDLCCGKNCDDQNSCTNDSCLDGSCVYSPTGDPCCEANPPPDCGCDPKTIPCTGGSVDPNTCQCSCPPGMELNSGQHCCPTGEHWSSVMCCAKGLHYGGDGLCCPTGQTSRDGECGCMNPDAKKPDCNDPPQPTTEPTAEPTTEPTAEPTTEPTAEPATEPTTEPTG